MRAGAAGTAREGPNIGGMISSAATTRPEPATVALIRRPRRGAGLGQEVGDGEGETSSAAWCRSPQGVVGQVGADVVVHGIGLVGAEDAAQGVHGIGGGAPDGALGNA